MLLVAKILVIDDDPSTLETFEFMNEMLLEGDIHTAIDYQQARKILPTAHWDIVILDIVLPQINGFDVCTLLKSEPYSRHAYYIMMSAERVDIIERMRAYHMRSQDFIVKPFAIEEVVLMLRSKIHFLEQLKGSFLTLQHQTAMLYKGHFGWCSDRQQVYQHETPLLLTPMEFALLSFFLKHVEQVLPIQMIIEDVWDKKPLEKPIDAANLRPLINKLRKKIEPNPAQPIYLLNAKNNGYIFYPDGYLGRVKAATQEPL